MTPEFQAELDGLAREAARKAVIEATEKWQKQHAEKFVFAACQSYAQGFLAEKREQIRAGFQTWIDTRLDEAVTAAAKQTLDQIVADVRARMKDLFEGVGATILTMVDAAVALNPPKEEYRFDLRPYTLPKDTRDAILAELRAQGYSAEIHGTPMEAPGGPIPVEQDILVVTIPREPTPLPPKR